MTRARDLVSIVKARSLSSDERVGHRMWTKQTSLQRKLWFLYWSTGEAKIQDLHGESRRWPDSPEKDSHLSLRAGPEEGGETKKEYVRNSK